MIWLGMLTPITLFLAVVAVVAVPKAAIVVVLVLALAAIVFCWPKRTELLARTKRSAVTLWLLVLAIWAATSALWSPVPIKSVETAVFLPVLAAAVTVVGRMWQNMSLSPAARCMLGVSTGLIFATLLLGVDLLTDQALTRWVLSHYPSLSTAIGKHVFVVDGKAVHVSEAAANRRAVIVALLAPSLVYYLSRGARSRFSLLAIVLTGVGLLTMFTLTQSLSAQVALLGGSLTFIGSRLWPGTARNLLVAAWIATLLAIPAALALHTAGWQDSDQLPQSARERIIIWNITARETLQHPLTGIGANASGDAVRQSDTSADAELAALGRVKFTHPHSAYLQVWYELGLPGALFLLFFGLAVLREIERLPPSVAPYAFGQFSITAILFASSYGVWQHWLLSSIGLGVMALMLADVVVKRVAQRD
jgi:O-antigen ligase